MVGLIGLRMTSDFWVRTLSKSNSPEGMLFLTNKRRPCIYSKHHESKMFVCFNLFFSLNCVYSVIVFTGFYLWFRPLGGMGEGVNVKLSITHWLQCIHVLNAAKFWKRKLGCTLIKRNVNKVVSVHLRSCLLQVHFFYKLWRFLLSISQACHVGIGCKFHQDSEQLGLHAPITNNGLRILTVHD